jgi:hypothetical protein
MLIEFLITNCELGNFSIQIEERTQQQKMDINLL